MPIGQDIPTKEEMVTATRAGTIMVESQVASTVVTWGTLGQIALKRSKRGRVFTIGAREAHQNPNMVTGTFPINQPYASILIDTSAEFSFVSIELKNLLGLVSSKLDVPYSIELANGELVKVSEIFRDCTLEL